MSATRPGWRSRVPTVLALIIASACSASAGKPEREDRMLEKGLALVREKDTQSICDGAGILGRLGRPEGIEPLLALLRTRDEAARECVREALAKLDVAPVLLARWRSSDATEKEQALEHAVALPHPGLMAIYAEAATDPDPKRRKRVATGLRRQADGPERLRLLAALAADQDKDVRWWAIDTLGLSKSAETTKILRARLAAEPDASLVTFIKRALGEPD